MNIKVLCVGINHYLGISKLTSCINDAKDWQQLFHKDLQVPKNNITRLSFGPKTNASTIKKELRKLVKSLGKGDLGVFIFSGHGNQKFTTTNGLPTIKEGIRARDKSIYENELRTITNKINPEACFVSIVDACYSGGVDFKELILKNLERKNQNLEIKSYANKILKENLIAKENYRKLLKPLNKNFITLSACKPNELAYGDLFIRDQNARMNGVLTYYTIGYIKDNPQITYAELIKKLQNILPDQSKGHDQTPQLNGHKNIINNTVFK